MKELTLEIKGQLLSKSNSRIFTNRNGSPRLIKSPRALQYIEDSMWQLKNQLRSHTMFEEPVSLYSEVYYSSRRPDLDVSLLMDLLEKVGVYKNDRLVEELHCFKKYDKENPRVLVRINKIRDSKTSGG